MVDRIRFLWIKVQRNSLMANTIAYFVECVLSKIEKFLSLVLLFKIIVVYLQYNYGNLYFATGGRNRLEIGISSVCGFVKE